MVDLHPPDRIEPTLFQFEDDGAIPNHPSWPLVVYRSAFDGEGDYASALERRFNENGWVGAWRNGIFAYHHYHSTSHEVLGVAHGEARVTFGGERGETLRIEAGDVAVLPAGTGHCRQSASSDFLVVGAYPREQESYDLCTGKPSERPEALECISRVPRPDADPLYGADGPLLEHWSEPPG